MTSTAQYTLTSTGRAHFRRLDDNLFAARAGIYLLLRVLKTRSVDEKVVTTFNDLYRHVARLTRDTFAADSDYPERIEELVNDIPQLLLTCLANDWVRCHDA